MAKLSLDDLRRLRDAKKEEFKKTRESGGEIQVTIGMGTCGIAAGARACLDAFISGLDEHKLSDTVKVRQTGCMGLCHSEPTVEVAVPGMPVVIYGNADAVVAKDIIQKHIIGRELLSGHILDRPAVDIMK
ncbi:MAG: (2Fe-2S) ferredoxin domain-containing protein [Treponema sp.]|jgi:NADP-reducing hydrogenase subunit HndB|nr:(2Fe-2S) ferredoxin domain-containing protein [Treponema sp.]